MIRVALNWKIIKVSFEDAKDVHRLATLFQRAREELQLAKDLLLGKKNNLPGFIVNNKDTALKVGHSSMRFAHRQDRYETEEKAHSSKL